MRRGLLIALLLLAPVPAHAAGPLIGPSRSLQWTMGTTNTDGTPITDLAGFEILLGPVPGVATAPTGVTVKDVGNLGVPAALTAPATVSVTIGALLPLTAGQKYACVRAYDQAGNRSACSNEIPFVIDVLAPSAPSGLTIP